MSSSSRLAGSLMAALAAVAAVLAPAARASSGPPTVVLKVASMAPEGGEWVRAVRDIDRELREQTDGAVRLKVYPGGVQGDDSVVLRKLRVGQLQAAGLATQGIGAVYPDLLALSVPFLFEDYDEIDHVLAEMDGFWTAGLRARGYVLLGWTDIGYVHLLSQVPVARVADIAGRKVWRPSQDPLTGVLFSRAGVVSVPLAVPDVLLGLQSGMVDVVYAPPAAAIAMQWFTRVKYVTELPINYVMGAFVIAEEPFSRLTPAQQELLLESSRRHLRAATLAARKANAEALAVMRRHGLELVTPAPGDVAAFRELVTTCLPEWLDVAFSRAAFARIEACLAAYRQREVSTP